jgi:hypothetical protein
MLEKKSIEEQKNYLFVPIAVAAKAYQISLWKYEIQKFFKEEKIDITIFYFSPKISK